MCNWEQAWLAYEPIENQKDKKYFESVYTQQNGVLIESALREIKTAAEKLFSITVRRGENREEAGLILELNPALNLGKEGYQITEEEDRIYIARQKKTGFYTEHSAFFLWYPPERDHRHFYSGDTVESCKDAESVGQHRWKH